MQQTKNTWKSGILLLSDPLLTGGVFSRASIQLCRVNSYTAGPSNQAVFTGMQND
jgi:hypothetical protein